MLGFESRQGQARIVGRSTRIKFLNLIRFFEKLHSLNRSNRSSHLCRESNPRPHNLVEIALNLIANITYAGVRGPARAKLELLIDILE